MTSSRAPAIGPISTEASSIDPRIAQKLRLALPPPSVHVRGHGSAARTRWAPLSDPCGTNCVALSQDAQLILVSLPTLSDERDELIVRQRGAAMPAYPHHRLGGHEDVDHRLLDGPGERIVIGVEKPRSQRRLMWRAVARRTRHSACCVFAPAVSRGPRQPAAAGQTLLSQGRCRPRPRRRPVSAVKETLLKRDHEPVRPTANLHESVEYRPPGRGLADLRQPLARLLDVRRDVEPHPRRSVALGLIGAGLHLAQHRVVLLGVVPEISSIELNSGEINPSRARTSDCTIREIRPLPSRNGWTDTTCRCAIAARTTTRVSRSPFCSQSTTSAISAGTFSAGGPS